MGWGELLKGRTHSYIISRALGNLRDFILKYIMKVAGMENSFGHGTRRLAGRRLWLSRKGVPRGLDKGISSLLGESKTKK